MKRFAMVVLVTLSGCATTTTTTGPGVIAGEGGYFIREGEAGTYLVSTQGPPTNAVKAAAMQVAQKFCYERKGGNAKIMVANENDQRAIEMEEKAAAAGTPTWRFKCET